MIESSSLPSLEEYESTLPGWKYLHSVTLHSLLLLEYGLGHLVEVWFMNLLPESLVTAEDKGRILVRRQAEHIATINAIYKTSG